MIKEGIIVGGFVFYIFVINSLIKDISISISIQDKRISTNLSLESLMMIKTALSLLKKWRTSMPAPNMMAKN